MKTLVTKKNFWAGLCLLTLGLLVVFVLIPAGVNEPKKVKFAALSPSYYPRIVALCMCVIGFVVTVRAMISGEEKVTDAEDVRPDGMIRIVSVFAVLALMAGLLTYLGFILTSALALLVTIWFAGERRIWFIVLLAISIPLVLHFFFLKVAGIPIPLGILHPFLAGV